MGHSPRPCIALPQTNARFVAYGMRYVWISLGYIGLAVSLGTFLGSSNRPIAYGVAGFAAVLFLTGTLLLVSFFAHRVFLRPNRAAAGKTRLDDRLWDAQLDGMEGHRA